jgi:hypothetical protein
MNVTLTFVLPERPALARNLGFSLTGTLTEPDMSAVLLAVLTFLPNRTSVPGPGTLTISVVVSPRSPWTILPMLKTAEAGATWGVGKTPDSSVGRVSTDVSGGVVLGGVMPGSTVPLSAVLESGAPGAGS